MELVDGENLAGTWRLTAEDFATPDGGTVNEWCLLPTREGPGLSLTKTVGTVPAVCAATDAVTVATGTTVYYCFHVENTGVCGTGFTTGTRRFAWAAGAGTAAGTAHRARITRSVRDLSHALIATPRAEAMSSTRESLPVGPSTGHKLPESRRTASAYE